MEKPTPKQRFEGFVNFLWDSNTGKVLGRGGRSWVEIGVFYIIYYACLVSFFAATLAVFYQTVPTDKPKLQGDSSLLDGSPGMGFKPMVDIEEKIVKFKKGGKDKNQKAYDNLQEFLDKYDDVNGEDCGSVTGTRVEEKTPCLFKPKEFTTCNVADEYGMKDDKPCILIKLNKVFNWKPDMWEDSDEAKLGDDITYDKTVIPIKCAAKTKSKQDDLGAASYFPQQGFPVAFFPYKKQQDYRSPFVFVQFPDMVTGKDYEIECRAYAKNINFDRTEVQGSVQFTLNVAK